MIISLLLKNLKEAQIILDVFEDKEEFNSYFKKLRFEFEDTIKKAEELIGKQVI
mgnify:CR=1 FL=1